MRLGTKATGLGVVSEESAQSDKCTVELGVRKVCGPRFNPLMSALCVSSHSMCIHESEWVSEIESTSFIQWHFCRCQVQCVILLWACSMPGLEGTSQGSVIQPARQSVAPGLCRGLHIPVTPGEKGKLSSPVTPNNVESEAVLKIQND